MVEIGHSGVGTAFDSEGPRHRVLTEPFRLADRLVTNAEWMEFIEDGGYTKPLLWLSEGWAKALAEGLVASALLGDARRPALDDDFGGLPARRSDRASRACQLLRGRCVRRVVWKAAAQRGGVGGGHAETRRGGQLPGPQSPKAQARVPTESWGAADVRRVERQPAQVQKPRLDLGRAAGRFGDLECAGRSGMGRAGNEIEHPHPLHALADDVVRVVGSGEIADDVRDCTHAV